jgi:hypothetical protein
MATPLIKIDQLGKTTGVAGQSREDLATDLLVTATAPNCGAGSYSWTFVPPYGSSCVATGLTGDTLTFTPDIEGTYLLYLNYNDQLSYTLDAIEQKVTTQGGAAVKLSNGNRIPGVGETTQFGTAGWAGAMDTKFRSDFRVMQAGELVSQSPFNTIDFRSVIGTNVLLEDVGDGIIAATLSGAVGSAIDVLQNGAPATGSPFNTMDFQGAGITVSGNGVDRVTVTISGGGGGVDLEVRDEGVAVDATTTILDFVGGGVEATASGTVVRVDIPAAGAAQPAPFGVRDDGVVVESDTTYIDFVGAGITATASGTNGVRVEVAAPGGSGSDLEVKDEGVSIDTTTTEIDFVGEGVTVTASGSAVRVDIPGGLSEGGTGTSDEKFITSLFAGGVETHDSVTPLIAGQLHVDPTEYSLTGATQSVVFRVVAAVSEATTEAKVQLYNLTDGEYIGSGVTFSSQTPTKAEETLTVGAGAGQMDNSAKVYETRVWLTTSGAGDALELGSAELRMINTID